MFGLALFNERRDPAFREAWAAEMAKAAQTLGRPADSADAFAVDLLLQDALEVGIERRMVTPLGGQPNTKPATRPSVQAAFCIDVRSEVFRRALEARSAPAETIGFAGFFGFAIEYVPVGQSYPQAQCPVLLKPALQVREHVACSGHDETAEALGLRVLRRRVGKAWKAFKLSAVSSFGFVETAGLSFAPKIAADALGRTRPTPDPRLDGFDDATVAKLGPDLSAFSPEVRLQSAETVLRAMSMTSNFARIVLLTGHGSTSVNNPHASGLDCGACGGHTGEANARVAAGILNDPEVRIGLAARGLPVPQDTWFVPALHDTTTDGVRLFDTHVLPQSHADDLRDLELLLADAGRTCRAERARLLDLNEGRDTDAQVLARARDWSQIRPEWGLAGCAAFIAAPRARSKALDLEGRAFLHSYDWRQDKGFGVLELIMTAPMVVASWINLQYYGSTVNNAAFGAGNKTLHNVVGALGVLEGNAGDLRVGLPLQSVNNGRRDVHEPVRLHVAIEAPQPAIDAVIAKHEGVRQLVENGWVHLFAIDGERVVRRGASGEWGASAK